MKQSAWCMDETGAGLLRQEGGSFPADNKVWKQVTGSSEM